jgi:hypothetical protein
MYPQPPLKNPIARDLQWLVSAPPLLAEVKRFPQHSPPERKALARGIDGFIQTLETMSEQEAAQTIGMKGWRVGHYFEALVTAWIQHLPQWEVLGKDVQVTQEKRTLGAFDFIVRNPEGGIEHWEVAVKYYLLLGQPDDWACWIGPNQRDRLDKKVNRMRDHQLALSTRPEAHAALQRLGVDRIHQRVALLKGILFSPWGTTVTQPTYAQSTPQGRWVEVSNLKKLQHSTPASRWMKREKPYWLAPIRKEGDATDFTDLPHGVQRPEMWARLTQAEDGMWEEAERWFLVPDGWSSGDTATQ